MLFLVFYNFLVGIRQTLNVKYRHNATIDFVDEIIILLWKLHVLLLITPLTLLSITLMGLLILIAFR